MHATSIQISILKYQFSLKTNKQEFPEDMADFQSGEKKKLLNKIMGGRSKGYRSWLGGTPADQTSGNLSIKINDGNEPTEWEIMCPIHTIHTKNVSSTKNTYLLRTYCICRELYSIFCNDLHGKKFKERICVYSLCCTAETNTALWSNYTVIKIKNKTNIETCFAKVNNASWAKKQLCIGYKTLLKNNIKGQLIQNLRKKFIFSLKLDMRYKILLLL